MKQYGLLAAVFGGTLAVLLVAFLVIEQLGAPGAVADASPSPSPSATAPASLTPRPTAAPIASASSAPSASVTASSSVPTKTSGPTITPKPTPAKTVKPGTTMTIEVPGSNYIQPIVGNGGKITPRGNGGVLLTSVRDYSDSTEVTYILPPGNVPDGTTITKMDVAICGTGQGDFWETYGPPDAQPIEHEVTPPDADGCWHYLGGNGKDSTAHAIISLASKLEIDKVVYTITTG